MVLGADPLLDDVGDGKAWLGAADVNVVDTPCGEGVCSIEATRVRAAVEVTLICAPVLAGDAVWYPALAVGESAVSVIQGQLSRTAMVTVGLVAVGGGLRGRRPSSSVRGSLITKNVTSTATTTVATKPTRTRRMRLAYTSLCA